ncbi:MAG: hypothetical protein U0936_26175 [Planctomycetaceae bacterium]
MSRNTSASGLFFVLTWLVGITPSISIAADKPVVGLKMELMSIRNRSSGPLPVRFRLEYNQPQMLEGDLQLSIYDGQDFYTAEDLIARLRFDDIVLVGQDYQFNAVLPPLRTSTVRNWSIEAVFLTESGPIQLSSIVDKQNPPEAFDLITSNPAERSVLLCSCSADPIANRASQNRRFLESALSLENYNPLNQSTDSQSQTSPQEAVDTLAANMMGRSIIHFAGQWAARDLPVDPLSYCAFDVVLLSDGALARLNQDQLDGLSKWVRAGGSVCIVPDAPMKRMHLEMLRNLFAKPDVSGTGLSLNDEGRLTVVSQENDPILMSHFGLGRALLLPAVESLESRLGKEDLGRVVAFLWKVRSDVGVWQGEKWSNADYLQQLKNLGIDAQKDEKGLYLTSEVRSKLRVRYLLGEQVNGRYYFDFQRMNSLFGIDDRLNPRTEPLLSVGEQLLLPEDSEMVPTWVIGLILTGYVLTIGPMDYFLLGWLHLRKYTWLVFPVVTLLFTFLTIAIAHSYMSSEDTGGRLVIVDVVDDGIPVRQTVLETLFLGAKTEITTDCKSQLVVQAEDSFTSADLQNMNTNVPERKSDTPLNYSGHFPQNYSIRQEVQQWSPVSLRTLSLEPEGVRLPAIDWADSTLITTSEGNQRLKAALAKNVDAVHSAVIYHNGSPLVLLGPYTKAPPDLANYFTNPTGTLRAGSRSAAIDSLISYIPTAVPSQSGIFRLVSQIAPQGAGTFEDLAICDATDSKQWVLVIMLTDGKEFQVFRKLYYVD